MNAKLLAAASLVIPNQGILVNVVSRRVRQLSQGHRPLIECTPNLHAADIALNEIIGHKLTYESTQDKKEAVGDLANVVVFPGTVRTREKVA